MQETGIKLLNCLMRKLRAFTLLEVLVVMSIMIILLSVAFYSYTSFAEVTKFNQDVANLQHDILILQRASMLLERDPEENWVYGLGVDFSGIQSGNGEYTFFKWCSEFAEFGAAKTKSEYPAYDEEDPTATGNLPGADIRNTSCEGDEEYLANLNRYGKGILNLKERVDIPGSINYIVFESVSGRAFLYDTEFNRVDSNVDLEMVFHKNFGQQKILTVENLTGRTKITEYVDE